jgi:sterol desaturase/sphingolipid hydroxylase (fatty acid hydroxylase superfamily)
MEEEIIYKWISIFTVLTARYVIIAGIAFLIFYVIFRNKYILYRIQKHFPTNKDYRREVGYSLLTTAIFSTIAIILFSPAVMPHTQVYTDLSERSWGYFILSIIMAIFIHDTYFYWTHRFMHHPKLFKIFHLVHHKSSNPSPWAAFSFHPLEAIVEAGVIFVIAFLIPIHPLALISFLIFMTIYNVYGHLGYEIYPAWVGKSPVAKYLNTSVNHNMHHKYFNQNYGLYFRFWDIIMRTTHKKYESTFEEITGRAKAGVQEVKINS